MKFSSLFVAVQLGLTLIMHTVDKAGISSSVRASKIVVEVGVRYCVCMRACTCRPNIYVGVAADERGKWLEFSARICGWLRGP